MANISDGIEDGAFYQDRSFTALDLGGRTLSGVEFEGCTFARCTFNEAVFARCRLVECRFEGCDLSVARFPETRLSEIAFNGCKLSGVDWTLPAEAQALRLPLSVSFDDCVLDYGSCFGVVLSGVTMRRCQAHELDLSEADLTGADLGETDFAGAKFLHTKLIKADLRGARRYAIDPTSNPVKGARFSLPEAVSLLRAFGVRLE
ncbi:MAG TPA: pentapeptide repeat-containing protein [Dehalococcoidia bacterium]|nr:pentapeptide repeat-containing protein [Dehalococcoidia bacterium]